MDSLVTVVVAVYNSEKYLNLCVDSILSQTYKNLELILVDDGSTDSSGSICDAYANADSRVVVIHKKNEGLSVVRNTAIPVAKGKYISFIDSDDILREDLYERAVKLLEETGSDLIKYAYCINKDGLEDKKGGNYEVIKSADAVKLILRDEFSSQLWQYLFKKQLWDDVISPAGRLAQDMMTLHLAVSKADSVVVTDEVLYYYYQDNSANVSNSNKKGIRGTADRAYAFWLRTQFCEENSQFGSEKSFCLSKFVEYSISCFCRKEFIGGERYDNDRALFREKIKKNLFEICKNPLISPVRKLCCAVIFALPKLLSRLYKEKGA